MQYPRYRQVRHCQALRPLKDHPFRSGASHGPAQPRVAGGGRLVPNFCLLSIAERSFFFSLPVTIFRTGWPFQNFRISHRTVPGKARQGRVLVAVILGAGRAAGSGKPPPISDPKLIRLKTEWLHKLAVVAGRARSPRRH